MGSIPTRSRHPGLVGRPAVPAAGGGDAAGSVPPEARPAGRAAATTAALVGAAALLLALPGPGGAQAPDTAQDGRPPGGVPAEPDTTAGPPISPLGALGRSVLLPGWGQAELDKPIRGAFYFAAEAASVWMVFKSNSKLSSARRAAPDTLPGQPNPLVESRTSQRENWIVLSVFVALMSGVDAWVSAHLYDFEGELEPPEDGTPGAQVRYSVPLEFP